MKLQICGHPESQITGKTTKYCAACEEATKTLDTLFFSEKNKPREYREQLELVNCKVKQKGIVLFEFSDYESAIRLLQRAGFVKNFKEKSFDVYMVPE
jgi:hypothetical protein